MRSTRVKMLCDFSVVFQRENSYSAMCLDLIDSLIVVGYAMLVLRAYSVPSSRLYRTRIGGPTIYRRIAGGKVSSINQRYVSHAAYAASRISGRLEPLLRLLSPLV